MNVNHQCKRCNYFLSGNQAKYRMGLLNKYGKESVEQLELKAQLRRVSRYSRFELELLIEYYRAKTKELKAA
jgi:uncharacterized membrane protein YkvA (DUF1232 family)